MWSGTPAMETKLYRRVFAALKRLPEIHRKIFGAGEAEREESA